MEKIICFLLCGPPRQGICGLRVYGVSRGWISLPLELLHHCHRLLLFPLPEGFPSGTCVTLKNEDYL